MFLSHFQLATPALDLLLLSVFLNATVGGCSILWSSVDNFDLRCINSIEQPDSFF